VGYPSNPGVDSSCSIDNDCNLSRVKKKAIIIGAGPAGLTAAYELLCRSDVIPVILEKSSYMGGISRTVNYKGNRIDLGGHRFFSKSDRVMNWWLQHLPLEGKAGGSQNITYQQQSREIAIAGAGPDPQKTDEVMLLRKRKSRIYYLRKFFDYPIQLTGKTLVQLGLVRTLRIGFSYMRSVLFPEKEIVNLEQFFINRFGRELYLTFFKDYTEKVWGVPCNKISAEWGEQRIKGLSITKAILHFLQPPRKKTSGVAQKGTETSLIEQFLYPKLGPGQMWEIVARKVIQMGGEILTGFNVSAIHCENGRIRAISGTDEQGQMQRFEGDYFFSTMPIQELIRDLDTAVPANVREVSDGLQYRDFITVGLLLKKLRIGQDNGSRLLIDDNWIYIQEPDVLAGRLQIFNNWSNYMVADPESVWLGVEYFCYETDDLWKKSDEEMAALAKEELDHIGIIDRNDVLDSTVIRMPKTYPAYFGTYDRFEELRKYVDGFENLFLVGRNGMHKYNNQDHSMLTAMVAVDNIVAGVKDKSSIWHVNTEMEYHEQK
jgi:protoporphyrinogen oxidase